MKNLLTQNLYSSIESQFNWQLIEEVRLRANCPIVICYQGKNFVLKNQTNNYYIATDYEINYVLAKATQNSLYAVNDQIKQMFISYTGGVRIGITGEVVTNSNQVSTIKHINSLNIRLPHQIKGFGNLALNFVYNNGVINNTLIVSEPGAGKTTLLRDLCKNISELEQVYNVLLVDERYEIASCINGRPMLDVGLFTDIISGGAKQFAFMQGVRSLKPDVIITDELSNSEDFLAVENAIKNGVKVIASVHAKNQLDLLKNTTIKNMLNQNYFSRIIVLSCNSKSRYLGIYDNNLNCLYMPY